jgi:HEAT repeat protein
MVVGQRPLTRALPEVRRLLGNARELPAVRVRAARALEAHRDSQSIPVLLGALGDSDGEVVAAAIRALGAIDDQRALNALIAEVGSATELRLVAAVQALGRLAVPEACPPLLAARQQPLWSEPYARAQLAVAMLSTLSRPCTDEAFGIGEILKPDIQAVNFFLSRAFGAVADSRRLHPAKVAAIDLLEAELRRRFPPR